jgi:hypothetical protein
LVVAVFCSPGRAAIVDNDPLEQGFVAVRDFNVLLNNTFEIDASQSAYYDDNLYRLSNEVSNLQTLPGIGADAARADHLEMSTLGFDGMWNWGKQFFTVDLKANDNRYNQNSNLDNVSTNDKVSWNWALAQSLSGEAGALYDSGLVSFINAATYGKDLYASTKYFGTLRYQLGPRWALYGGVLESGATLSDVALQNNDLHTKSVEIGSELATNEKDSAGLEYRYTDARFPKGNSINSDYREDAARFVFNRAFSEKTDGNFNFGFLKRNYASSDIGNFSGDVWRFSLRWQPRDRLQFDLTGARNLQAYLTAQSDYYVSTGARVAPTWIFSEKLNVTLAASYESQTYVGVTEAQILAGTRRDRLSSGQATIEYLPRAFLVFDFGYAYEDRKSDEARYQYDDNVISAKVTFKYQ